MQTKTTLPMDIQPSPRTWVFSTDLRARLPLVVLFWSTCWLLTGCGSGKRSYQQFMLGQDPAIPSHSAIQAPMVNPYDLSEQSSDETFEQFFKTRWAGEIWMMLLHYVSPDTFGNLIDEKTISKGHIMRHLLSQHPTRMQDQLKVGIEAYVQRLNQEVAYKKFLEHNRLDAVWESLDQARGQATLDLSRQLQSCATSLKIEVLEGIVRFILNHCPNLVELDLSYNGLTMLPETFGNLMNLRGLNLSCNGLRNLSASFGNLRNLNHLDLKHNKLSALPDTFGNLIQLTNLDLSANQLTELPASFRNLTKLRWFTGCNLNETALQDLTAILFQDFLYHIGLYPVWQNLQQASGQHALDLSGMLQSLSKELQSLVLERMVPFIINHCPNLDELNLSDNKLKALPESLGELTQLRTLYLNNNQLSELPESFGNLTQLSVLWLEKNDLSALPVTFVNLINLEMLDLSNNKLKALPNSFGNFKRLNDLNLSSNKLTTLPDSFGSLQNLERLFLAINKLTKLPNSFGNLCQLNELNLDNNKLTTLPLSFQNLTKLGAFEVMNNSLLDPNVDLGGTYFLLTNDNMQYNPLSPNVYQQEKINKGTYDLVINRDICQVTLPICPKYIQCDQSCSAIILIQKLGGVDLPRPLPLSLSSWREVVEQRYSGANVFLINETINPETRQ